MKKLLGVVLMATMLLSIMPMVLATSVGTGVGVDVQTEDFEPMVWMCDSRIVFDDQTEPGRYTPGPEVITPSSYTIYGKPLDERINNYAFEGEQIVYEEG